MDLILLACALKKELAVLKSRSWDHCELVATGLGTRRTTQALERVLQSSPPCCIVFTGTAGQLDPGLKLGQVVVAEEWCLEDGACTQVDRQLTVGLRDRGCVVSGRGLTVSLPVVRAGSRLSLYRRYGASICDMESAGVLEVASRYGLPCVVAKVVSDTAESGIARYWSDFRGNMGVLADHLEEFLPRVRKVLMEQEGGRENR